MDVVQDKLIGWWACSSCMGLWCENGCITSMALRAQTLRRMVSADLASWIRPATHHGLVAMVKPLWVGTQRCMPPPPTPTAHSCVYLPTLDAPLAWMTEHGTETWRNAMFQTCHQHVTLIGQQKPTRQRCQNNRLHLSQGPFSVLFIHELRIDKWTTSASGSMITTEWHCQGIFSHQN